MSISPILAQITVEPKELGSYWHNSNISRAGLGAVASAISVVTVLILVWAIFIRKPSDERPRRYQYPAPPAKQEGDKNEQNSNSGRHSRRKKRRRRGHRTRKPTLAETGGLPPLREDVPSDDPP